MFIKSVHVRRFRSLFDESIECDSLTALVGRNGSGKSTFLRALDLFYASSPKVDGRDFYGELCEENIEIEVSFVGLGTEERDRFQKYVEGDHLTVVRVFTHSEGKISHKY